MNRKSIAGRVRLCMLALDHMVGNTWAAKVFVTNPTNASPALWIPSIARGNVPDIIARVKMILDGLSLEPDAGGHCAVCQEFYRQITARVRALHVEF